MLRYAVIGDPIEHSLSPTIHSAFAEQLGIQLTYDRILVKTETFHDQVNEFFASGGQGLNVTAPLKTLAFDYADLVTDRAMLSGAANTLKFLDNDMVYAHSTDGEGLVRDLQFLGVPLNQKRILLLGAGGAAKSCVDALFKERPEALFIHNRTESSAKQLISDCASSGTVQLLENGDTEDPPFDLVINATSASLYGARPDVDPGLLKNAVCYDMMYGDNAKPFTKWASAQGAKASYDGMGMLIEQAAASFMIWHDVMPDTVPVRQQLLSQQSRSR